MVVLVEEVDAAVEALRWAARNFLRRGDLITLLHVLPASRSRKRQRLLRLRGFQLALSFRDLCSRVPEVGSPLLREKFLVGRIGCFVATAQRTRGGEVVTEEGGS